MRLLVTDAEIRKTLAVVRALGEAHEVWTCSASDSRPAIASWSRFSRKHLRYRFDSSFPEWLVETVSGYAIDAVFCPQETTIVLAGQAYDELSATGTTVTFPNLATVDRAFDKAKTIAIAQNLGIHVPKTVVLEDLRDAMSAAKELGYPIVVKQRYSNYWTGHEFIRGDGTHYAENPDDLKEIIARQHSNQPAPLLQEFVPGRGLAVFLLLDKSGNVCAEFAHRRIRDVRPTGSGSVLRESIELAPRLREISVSLLREMGWWGVAMVELRTDDRGGDVCLMEVNGRFWGSLQLAIDAGVNFPELLLQVANGDTPSPVPEFREGIRVRWWLGDLARTIRILKGPPRGYPGQFPKRRDALRDFLGRQPEGTIGEVFRFNDPLPTAAEILATVRGVL